MKIERHEKAEVSRPPRTGPSAAPATPAAAQRRAPTLSEPLASTSSSSPPTITSAPPIACTARAKTRKFSDWAAAHPAVARAKTTSPPATALAGSPRTHSRAAGTAASASTRLNAISTHATCPTCEPKSSRISGSASVTTPESPSTTATTSTSAATMVWRLLIGTNLPASPRRDARSGQRKPRPCGTWSVLREPSAALKPSWSSADCSDWA